MSYEYEVDRTWTPIKYDHLSTSKIPLNDFVDKLEILLVTAQMADWEVAVSHSDSFFRDCISFYCREFENLLQINMLVLYNDDWSFDKITRIWSCGQNQDFRKYIGDKYGLFEEAVTPKDIDRMFEMFHDVLSKIDSFSIEEMS
ncbi:MAG: hypothetical protein K0R18_426 [Bacillales bacterium]|jgi:hypothetical protein|nr:hypothetical protein [Bacillales bacterium]